MSRTVPLLETVEDTGDGPHPPYLYPDYRSTRTRAPSRPLLLLPPTLSELTGPAFGHDAVGELDHDLTRQHEASRWASASSSAGASPTATGARSARR